MLVVMESVEVVAGCSPEGAWEPPSAGAQGALGPELQQLDVILWDQSPLAVQSPFQPARLPGALYVLKDGSNVKRQFRAVLCLARVHRSRLPTDNAGEGTPEAQTGM